MTAPARFARAWLWLARGGGLDVPAAADLAALARATAERGPHRLELGEVTLTSPAAAMAATPGGRVLIGTRRDGARLEVDPATGAVWRVDGGGPPVVAFEDLDDLLRTYHRPRRDQAGLGAALAAVDRHDRYQAPGAFERARAEAEAAAAAGALSIAPTRDVPIAAAADLSPEGRRRLATHPVRTRMIDVATGAATVVLEGWWQLAAAWLDDDRIAVLCAEGEVTLDRRDPEVATLAAVAGAFPGEDLTLQAHSAGLLHVVTAEGRHLRQVQVRAERVATAAGGRLVVLTRPAARDRWATAVLGVTARGARVLAKHPAELGELRGDGPRVVGAHGFELLGVERALATVGDGWPEALADGLALEPPPPPPPARIALADARDLHLELRPASLPPEADAATRLDVDTAALGEVARSAASPDDARCAVACGGEVWDVDVASGRAELVHRGWPQVLSVRRGADAIWLLARVVKEHAEVQRYTRRDGAWVRDVALPVMGLDRLHLGAGGRLLAITLDHAPAPLAFTMLVGVDDDGALRHLGRLPRAVARVIDDGTAVLVELEGGQVYELRGVEAALARARAEEPRPLRAVVFDVRGHYGRREFLPRHGGELGFLDRDGHEAIACRFTSTFDFERDAARAAHVGSGLYGLVAADGGLVEPHHYAWIGPRAGGVRRVARGAPDLLGRFPAEAAWGLWRPDGGVVWLAGVAAVTDLAGGFARVAWRGGGCGWVDRDGGALRPAPLTDGGEFAEGRCAAADGERWGYLDGRGAWAIPPRFAAALPFARGVAGVRLPDGRWRYVDAGGAWVGDDELDELTPHRAPLAAIRIGARWGFADAAGAVVIAPRFDEVGELVDGLAPVRIGDAWTWVTATGELLGPPRFARTFAAGAGRGRFQHGGLHGFVSADGAIVAEGFVDAGAFHEGLAPVQRRGLWGFLAPTGELVIEPSFTAARPFAEGLAAVQRGGAWGYVDRAGAPRVPLTLADAGSFHHGRAWFRPPRR